MRLAIASSSPRAAMHGDCGDAVGLRRLRIGEDDCRLRLLENALDARIGLLGECGFDAWAALASRDLNTASAASSRFAGSAASSVSEPSAASTAPRTRLLRRTFFSPAGSAETAAPVARVGQRAGVVLDVDLAVGLGEKSRPSFSAWMISAERGSPVAATALMAATVSLNLSLVKPGQRVTEAFAHARCRTKQTE